MIESINNEKVKSWAKLNDKKYQKETNLFLVEGEHLVEEAFKCGRLREVIVLDGIDCKYENFYKVSEQVMRKISTLTNVPRMVGVAEMLEPRCVEGNVLLLDGVQDPGNMGTIIRSAVAFGVHTIVLGEGSVSIYNPKVVRATEGLLFHINVIEASIENMILELQKEGYTTYSSKVDGGTNVADIEFSKKSAIVVGNEGKGVRQSTSDLCDEYLYIPMKETCESLNVGVATSIILYELSKKI